MISSISGAGAAAVSTFAAGVSAFLATLGFVGVLLRDFLADEGPVKVGANSFFLSIGDAVFLWLVVVVVVVLSVDFIVVEVVVVAGLLLKVVAGLVALDADFGADAFFNPVSTRDVVEVDFAVGLWKIYKFRKLIFENFIHSIPIFNGLEILHSLILGFIC